MIDVNVTMPNTVSVRTTDCERLNVEANTLTAEMALKVGYGLILNGNELSVDDRFVKSAEINSQGNLILTMKSGEV